MVQRIKDFFLESATVADFDDCRVHDVIFVLYRRPGVSYTLQNYTEYFLELLKFPFSEAYNVSA